VCSSDLLWNAIHAHGRTNAKQNCVVALAAIGIMQADIAKLVGLSASTTSKYINDFLTSEAGIEARMVVQQINIFGTRYLTHAKRYYVEAQLDVVDDIFDCFFSITSEDYNKSILRKRLREE
jgi:predicted transcriptional regulator